VGLLPPSVVHSPFSGVCERRSSSFAKSLARPVHEACHNGIFKQPSWNKVAGIVADLANIVPTAIAFRCYHIKHHSHLAHLGDYAFDADLPSHWEANLFGRTWYGKAVWLFLFPILQVFRLGRLDGIVPAKSRWMVANFICVLAFDIAIMFYAGVGAILYLFASFYFSLGGLHILGGRFIQEHFTLDGRQETADYWGPLNLVALNAGYHNEHHDSQRSARGSPPPSPHPHVHRFLLKLHRN
jgi:sphingolipid 4-desaturase/C4-monooxygenase